MFLFNIVIKINIFDVLSFVFFLNDSYDGAESPTMNGDNRDMSQQHAIDEGTEMTIEWMDEIEDESLSIGFSSSE